ncbi:hypothetical protein E1B28_004763 [Marasmius oreades]|uniref:Autophagy-related protein 29 n=1 Tax=Marasmius oreades TaxID=181124 RepID=A0A9P7UZ88_9AGAR|nr:uncharacterized protein E1B28_004763 [Marasmius oreades]KAG7097416.1 hypothetical protein E1B28_004763 [Marasmius oreades]
MPLPPIPNVRVIVRLPENRPAVPLNDPPKIEWTSEKADILWKVIEKSRTSDNGGTDWKGLAAHLEVPLPYLLYRAHARFQEDLRGLQDIAVTSPTSGTQPSFEILEEQPIHSKKTSREGGSTGSSRTTIRARLNSLGSHYNQNHNTPKKTTTSSSTLTLQGLTHPHKPLITTKNKTPITSDDESSDSEDEEMLKEEEAERRAEEQETLNRKLLELQRMMTTDALGLVAPRKRRSGSGNAASRGFSPRSSTSASQSTSASVSSASASVSSPQGSIPEIPTGSGSSPSQSQSQSQSYSHSSRSRQLKSPSSPPALSPRSAIGQRYGLLMGKSNSEQESVNGSEASSFSDISDASLSGSALESALLSNIRGGGGSKFSAFARSRFGGGRSGMPH